MADQDRARWTKLVADYEASELTQREFATERGISFSNLRNWIYRLRKELRAPAHADHRFRRKPIADSGPSRSPIPEQADR
jgi:hypothetical protein